MIEPSARLSDLLWMGGSPCAGKSTIAEDIAHAWGLSLYHCDEAFEAHTRRADAAAQPLLAAIPTMTWEEIWLGRTVDKQVADELAVYDEEFPMVLADLAAMPRERPLLAEGNALLPRHVAPLLTDPRRALWVVPTEAFQRATYPTARAAWVRPIVGQTHDPERALKNWMDRDVAFAREVEAQARALGLRVIVVDGSRTIAEHTAEVVALWQPFLAGP